VSTASPMEIYIVMQHTIHVQQEKKQKLKPKFNATPFKVIAPRGLTVVAGNNEQHCSTTSVSQFKCIPDVNDMDCSSKDGSDTKHELGCDYRRSNRTRAPVQYGLGFSY